MPDRHRFRMTSLIEDGSEWGAVSLCRLNYPRGPFRPPETVFAQEGVE